MKPASKNKLLGGLVLALALLGVVAWFNWRHTARMQETMERVSHTERVRDELDRLLIQMQDVEAGARGFVVTSATGRESEG